jgi:hypothetical protein
MELAIRLRSACPRDLRGHPEADRAAFRDVGPVISGDPVARFAGLIAILVDAAGRLRTAPARSYKSAERAGFHALLATPAAARPRIGWCCMPGMPGSGCQSGTSTTPGSTSSRPPNSSRICANVRNYVRPRPFCMASCKVAEAGSSLSSMWWMNT